MIIDSKLCDAIRSTLWECDGRPLLESALLVYVRPLVTTPVVASDLRSHLLHLENAGEVDRNANRDDKTILSWSLTDAGRQRAKG